MWFDYKTPEYWFTFITCVCVGMFINDLMIGANVIRFETTIRLCCLWVKWKLFYRSECLSYTCTKRERVSMLFTNNFIRYLYSPVSGIHVRYWSVYSRITKFNLIFNVTHTHTYFIFQYRQLNTWIYKFSFHFQYIEDWQRE